MSKHQKAIRRREMAAQTGTEETGTQIPAES